MSKKIKFIQIFQCIIILVLSTSSLDNNSINSKKKNSSSQQQIQVDSTSHEKNSL